MGSSFGSAALCAASPRTTLEADLERAARAYDSRAAIRTLSRVRQQRAADPSLAGLQVRTGLLAMAPRRGPGADET